MAVVEIGKDSLLRSGTDGPVSDFGKSALPEASRVLAGGGGPYGDAGVRVVAGPELRLCFLSGLSAN
jgi:hypothetical protein